MLKVTWGLFFRKALQVRLRKAYNKTLISSDTRASASLQGHTDGTISLRALATSPLAQGIKAARVGEAGAAKLWLEPHAAAITCMMQHRWQFEPAAAPRCVLITGVCLACSSLVCAPLKIVMAALMP